MTGFKMSNLHNYIIKPKGCIIHGHFLKASLPWKQTQSHCWSSTLLVYIPEKKSSACMCVLPVAGQHGGAGGFGQRGRRAGGVAGESALCYHPGQEGLVLAHHAGDTHGIICRPEKITEFSIRQKEKKKKKESERGMSLTLFVILIGAAERVLGRLTRRLAVLLPNGACARVGARHCGQTEAIG